MHIHKLQFFIDPIKVYAHLQKGKRKGKLVMLHDATEGAPSYIGYAGEIFEKSYSEVSSSNIKYCLECIEDRIKQSYDENIRYIESHPDFYELKSLPFIYGVLGYLAYDTGLYFTDIFKSRSDRPTCPAYHFILPEELLIFDPSGKVMWLIQTSKDDTQLHEVIAMFEEMKNKTFHNSLDVLADDAFEYSPSMTYEEYIKSLEIIKNKLIEGETYQVNFSQKFTFKSHIEPLDVYRKITEINPSKRQFFVDAPNLAIISNSPELLFEVKTLEDGSRKILTSPIKGTAGIKGYESDAELVAIANQLIQSEKNKAELEMIVDMARNDVGVLSRFGTVAVENHRYIEKFSHVLHTVSDVSGVLRQETRLYDIFASLFPGASITGCPKIRTMQIISETEKSYRGVYCGSAGFIDIRGNMSFNILIRTLYTNSANAPYEYVLSSGGGIVIDSDSAVEYKETFDKAAAFASIFT